MIDNNGKKMRGKIVIASLKWRPKYCSIVPWGISTLSILWSKVSIKSLAIFKRNFRMRVQKIAPGYLLFSFCPSKPEVL